MKQINIIIAFSLIIFIACSNNKSEQSPEKENKNIENTTQQDKKTNNIKKINVCELVPASLLAEKIGGKVLKPSQHSDYGSTQGCEYEIDPPGPDNYEYCAIWLYPTSLYEDVQSALETAKGLNQKVTAEQLTGYGDESFVIHNATEDQSIIHVFLNHKFYVEVKAEKFEDAKKITELVLSKLK